MYAKCFAEFLFADVTACAQRGKLAAHSPDCSGKPAGMGACKALAVCLLAVAPVLRTCSGKREATAARRAKWPDAPNYKYLFFCAKNVFLKKNFSNL